MKIVNERLIRAGLSLTAIVLLFGFAQLPATRVAARAQADDALVATLDLVADGLAEPVYVSGPDDGSDRLFVIEKAGTIRIIENGSLIAEPFLDISERVLSEKLEQGMLGLAFHPDFALNGRFFVTHVPLDGAWRLEEYRVSADRNRADPASARELIFLPKEDHYGGHYAGMLAFGPDGYLYVSIGDGGGAFDPFSHAQNLATLPGSVLRLDIDGGDPYAIPDDNPFVAVEGARPEIWLYGLRNPWRFSFDRETGELYIGDVGHVEFEEIDYAPANTSGGVNYGWPVMEGPGCSEVAPNCDPLPFQLPVHAYPHTDGCTVIGGYAYRWHPASQLYGRYIFGDYCRGTLWSLERGDDGHWQHATLLDTDFNISSFGEGPTGRIYVTDITGGGVYELVDEALRGAPAIEYLSQSVIVTGGAACHLDIHGSNFREDAIVLWNGATRDSDWVDARTIRVTIDAQTDLDEGAVQISITHPDPESIRSNEVPVQVIADLIADDALAAVWGRYDQPVLSGVAERTWTWGPQGSGCATLGSYVSSEDGVRAVQYFDKGRLEVTHPVGDPATTWYVTSGLLATEMLTGRVQNGDNEFEARVPAHVNVAGDAGEGNGPSYATLGQRLDDDPQPVGALISLRMDAAGTVSLDPSVDFYDIRSAVVDDVTNHAIAGPFWEYLNSSGTTWDGNDYVEGPVFANPYYVSGRPVTEAYWAEVTVGGRQLDVLLQCFERRCLTYTPDNPDGWQVEAGNTGLHYLRWRYE